MEDRKAAVSALFLTGLGAMLAIVVAATALPAVRHSQGGRQVIGFAVIYAVIVALGTLGYVAVHHEHQFRSVSSQSSPDSSAGIPRASSWLPWKGGVRRQGPISALVVGALASIVCLGAFAMAFSFHSAGAQSHRTQSEGVRATATVLSVDHVKHTAGYNHVWYSTLVQVALPSGQTSVVHDPHNPTFGPGWKVSVLLDPTDRSYSEIPGLPQEDRYTWLVALFICITAASLSAGSFSSYRQMRHGPRPAKAVAEAAPAT